MEDKLENEIFSNEAEHIFLHKQFEEICPFYMSIGMTYDEFWYGDTKLTRYYLKAFELKEKRRKWARWEQGLYIYEAFCDVSPILRAFSKAKKPLPYPSKPYGIEEEIKQDKERQKEKEKVEIIKTQIFFENWVKANQKKFKEKGENNG